MQRLGCPARAMREAFRFQASRQPMLWASVAYSLGTIAGVYLWQLGSRGSGICGVRSLFRGAELRNGLVAGVKRRGAWRLAIVWTPTAARLAGLQSTLDRGKRSFHVGEEISSTR